MANLYVQAVPPTDLNRNTEWFMYSGVWTTYILILFFAWLVVLSVSGCSPGMAWTTVNLGHALEEDDTNYVEEKEVADVFDSEFDEDEPEPEEEAENESDKKKKREEILNVSFMQEKVVCVITGLPAKYRDPKTGLPYATKEAFKIIREKYLNDGSGIKEKNSMGVLYEFTSGEGGYLRLILSRILLGTLEEMFHLVGVAVHGKWHLDEATCYQFVTI